MPLCEGGHLFKKSGALDVNIYLQRVKLLCKGECLVERDLAALRLIVGKHGSAVFVKIKIKLNDRCTVSTAAAIDASEFASVPIQPVCPVMVIKVYLR